MKINCKEKIENKHTKDKNIVKLGTIIIIKVNIEMLHLESIVYLKKFL